MKIIEETYKWANTNFKEQKPDTLVIHHALSPKCTAQDIHRWHLDNDWKGIAYHYFISKSGSIYRGRKENHKGGHLLGSENNNTIGICLEGCYTDYKNLTEKIVPAPQWDALIWLCNDIKNRWDIKKIKRHAEYPSAKQEGKDCPGEYFPWDKFLIEVDSVVIRIQKALKTIGLYTGEIDGKAGPLTKKAMNEFYPMLQQTMQIPDAYKLKSENDELKNDIRIARNALLKW